MSFYLVTQRARVIGWCRTQALKDVDGFSATDFQAPKTQMGLDLVLV